MPASSAVLNNRDKLGLLFFGACGTFTAYLGYWQLNRLQWKIDLIKTTKDNLKSTCIDINNIEDLYKNKNDPINAVPVDIRGTLLYNQTIFLGPRQGPSEGGKSANAKSDYGYYVLTPLQTENKGFFPTDKMPKDISKLELPKEAEPFKAKAVITKGEDVPSFISEIYQQNTNSYISMHLPSIWDRLKLKFKTTSMLTDISNKLSLDIIEPQLNGLRRKTDKGFSEDGCFSITPDMHMLYAATWISLTAIIAGLSFYRYRRILKLKKI